MDSDLPGPIGIDGVYVSVPRRIGAIRGEAVVSAIAKAPVHGDLALSSINLEGDDQADRTVHGGPDKAVYAYPGVHYPAWSAEGADLAALRFGENITCAGVTEAEVRIGERWRWGDAELQVSQPRSPCYKLGMHTARSAILRRLVETGRCGWYLRVLTPGRVRASGSITVLDRPPTAPTVAETFAAVFPTAPGHREADVERVLGAAALADQWRHAVQRRASRATT